MAILGRKSDSDSSARILSAFSSSSPSNTVLGQSRALGAPFIRRARGGRPTVPGAPQAEPQRPTAPRAIDMWQTRPATPQPVLTEPVRRGTGTLQAYEGSPQAYSNQLLADAFDPRENPAVREQMQSAFGLQEFFDQNQTNLVRMLGTGANAPGVIAPGSRAYIPRGAVANQVLQLAQDEAYAKINAQSAAQQAAAQQAAAAQDAANRARFDTVAGTNQGSALDVTRTAPTTTSNLIGGTNVIGGSSPIPSPSNEPSSILGGGGVERTEGGMTPELTQSTAPPTPGGALGSMPSIEYLDASKGEFRDPTQFHGPQSPESTSEILATNAPQDSGSLSQVEIDGLKAAGISQADYAKVRASGDWRIAESMKSVASALAYAATLDPVKQAKAIASLYTGAAQAVAGANQQMAKNQVVAAKSAAMAAARNRT